MSWVCPVDGEEFTQPTGQRCPNHNTEKLVRAKESRGVGDPAPEPAPPSHAPSESGSCWRCRRPYPDAAVDTCPDCLSPVAVPALALRSGDGGLLTAERGTTVRLGRDPTWTENTDFIGKHGTVHGRHAIVEVAADGTVTVRPLMPPRGYSNGTYVNGREIVEKVAHPVSDGAELRLGETCVITIQIFERTDLE
ncbi:FHA domain-containing protein [Catellatospora sp. KI3]|uniref:FHA domain-containing protein n=1 Tax=Catellatospora sp. KI3 TaxID=3041620 RepID=UPI0024832CDD|nr:FHA domain-containing protein [Catellatospora sp. KI3]MDI1462840.1 FHA domain-containing protein [Catellatospora sp. KI3]